MESKYIIASVHAVQNVFKTMLKTDVAIGKPHLKQAGATSSGVSGIIGYTGSVRGSMVLCFPLDLATKLIERFAGVALSADHPDFADAIGELVNMVAGGAKTRFNEPGVTISCPSVVVGKEHRVFQRKDERSVAIPCSCSLGAFTIDIALQADKSPATDACQAQIKVA